MASHFGTERLVRLSRLERHLGNATNGGQRLAAEAQRADVEEILDLGEFAGGVACEGQGQIFRLDAAAVVHDLDQVDAHGKRTWKSVF
jgi:hypothetical protein